MQNLFIKSACIWRVESSGIWLCVIGSSLPYLNSVCIFFLQLITLLHQLAMISFQWSENMVVTSVDICCNQRPRFLVWILSCLVMVESSWSVMAHSDVREGKWRGNWQMEWVASTLHTTSEHGVSSITTITTADAHTSAAGSLLNWCPCWFKWIRPFCRKMKSGFCACAITFQTQSTASHSHMMHFQGHTSDGSKWQTEICA